MKKNGEGHTREYSGGTPDANVAAQRRHFSNETPAENRPASSQCRKAFSDSGLASRRKRSLAVSRSSSLCDHHNYICSLL
jgi:hypothetical protein